MAIRARRRLVDYYRTSAVRMRPEPSTAAWDRQLHGPPRRRHVNFLSPFGISTRLNNTGPGAAGPLLREPC
jgi:hypothetical protein